MNEQDMMNSLQELKQLPTQAEIDALKAQVNYLRDTIVDYIKCVITEDELGDAIQTTQEQCLAEVKAKAIKEYKQERAELLQMEFATKIMVSSI